MDRVLKEISTSELLTLIKSGFPNMDIDSYILKNYKRKFPEWILNGSSILDKDENELEDVVFPIRIKQDISILSMEDFTELLENIRFFDVKPYPSTLLPWILTHRKQCSEVLQNLMTNTSDISKQFYTLFISILDSLKPKDNYAEKIMNSKSIYPIIIDNMHLFSYSDLEFINDNIFDYCWKCCQYAVKNGNLELLKWLQTQNCRIVHSVAEIAADHGQLHILEWIIENDFPYNTNDLYRSSIRGGHIDIFKWLLSKNIVLSDLYKDSLCLFAVYGGQLSTLKWLREQGYSWDKYIPYEAAKKDHLEIFIWAIENGCPWDRSSIIYAGTNKTTLYIRENYAE